MYGSKYVRKSSPFSAFYSQWDGKYTTVKRQVIPDLWRTNRKCLVRHDEGHVRTCKDVSGINFVVLCVNLIPVPLSLTCLFMLQSSKHIFSLCQLATLTIHNSLALSLPAQDLPLSQIFPRPTQPPTLIGMVNEYQPKCCDALRLASKGRYGSFHLWINVWATGKTA